MSGCYAEKCILKMRFEKKNNLEQKPIIVAQMEILWQAIVASKDFKPGIYFELNLHSSLSWECMNIWFVMSIY